MSNLKLRHQITVLSTKLSHFYFVFSRSNDIVLSLINGSEIILIMKLIMTYLDGDLAHSPSAILLTCIMR